MTVGLRRLSRPALHRPLCGRPHHPPVHLEGVPAGRHVSVFRTDPGTGERLGLLATATVDEDGWVNLAEPVIVKAGEAFVAVPEF